MTTLLINGTQHQIDAEDDMPLLWAIRDLAGLSGTKYGCGMGLCGACSIMLDGKLTFSCTLPVSAAQGKAITTIEGLATDKGLHPVQQAWVEQDVPQCGYCQSGQIIAAAALLKQNPHPSDEEIRAKMSNLCRCGTYQQIFAAIKRAAEIQGAQS
ncbi:(2Fe-2S)-binding protein [Methylomicrobium lacus]|uniref:(2Fe-2S)-binding protein n=1 Tax=Methylomicrobium lacus TaxID=136992 RepID=UPI00045E93D5|nr:(2Fe-2S)-binding protein [Methylomicrobium lacus]